MRVLLALVGMGLAFWGCKPQSPGVVSQEAGAGLKKGSFIESAVWAIPYAHVKQNGEREFAFRESPEGYPYMCFYKREFQHSEAYNPGSIEKRGSESNFSAQARENFLYLCSQKTQSLLPYPIQLKAVERLMNNWKNRNQDLIKAHFWGSILATTGAVGVQIGLGALGPIGGALGMAIGFGGMHLASSQYGKVSGKLYDQINAATAIGNSTKNQLILNDEFDSKLNWIPTEFRPSDSAGGVRVSTPFFGDLDLKPEMADFFEKELKKEAQRQEEVAANDDQGTDYYFGCQVVGGQRVCPGKCKPTYASGTANAAISFYEKSYLPAFQAAQGVLQQATAGQIVASKAELYKRVEPVLPKVYAQLPAYGYKTDMEAACQALFAYTPYGKGAKNYDKMVAPYGLSVNVANEANSQVAFTQVYYGHPKNKAYPGWIWNSPLAAVVYEICRPDIKKCIRKWNVQGQIVKEAETNLDGTIIKELKSQVVNPYAKPEDKGKLQRRAAIVWDFKKPGKYSVHARAWLLNLGILLPVAAKIDVTRDLVLGANGAALIVKDSLVERRFAVRAHQNLDDPSGMHLSAEVNPLEW